MLPVETLGAFFAASVVMGLAPGPDILFVLTQSALYGARAGFATTCGLITGLFVHITAVSLGVAALFQSSETAFNVLKFAGAAYLLYLAWLSFRSGTSKAALQKAQFPGYGTLYRRGVIMNITNPKVTLFFLAFLPQFADPRAGRPYGSEHRPRRAVPACHAAGLRLRVAACGTGRRAFQQFRQGAVVPEPRRRLRFYRAGGHAASLFPLIAPPILPLYPDDLP